MPEIVDYPRVVEQMATQGFVSLYHNSGAFGFAAEAAVQSIGWVGPSDPTIRPAALPLTHPVPPPYETNLAALASRAWRELLPGPVWLLPKSHWAYELSFGSHVWMPAALRAAGLSPEAIQTLTQRHDGTGLRFDVAESAAFEALLEALLRQLLGSDFMLFWPERPVVCSVHHHKQLWWTTTDGSLLAALQGMVPAETRNAKR